MVWAVLVIAGILLAIKYPAFRKVSICLIVLLTLAVVGYFLNDKYDHERAKGLIRKDQLEFLDFRLGPSSYGSYVLTGRIKNNSVYPVTSIMLKIDGQDCNDQGHCDVIGEADEDIFTTIPAGQVRDVNETVYFPTNMQVEGKFQWNYSITEIDAKP